VQIAASWLEEMVLCEGCVDELESSSQAGVATEDLWDQEQAP
jgi:hypothetical protein